MLSHTSRFKNPIFSINKLKIDFCILIDWASSYKSILCHTNLTSSCRAISNSKQEKKNQIDKTFFKINKETLVAIDLQIIIF